MAVGRALRRRILALLRRRVLALRRRVAVARLLLAVRLLLLTIGGLLLLLLTIGTRVVVRVLHGDSAGIVAGGGGCGLDALELLGLLAADDEGDDEQDDNDHDDGDDDARDDAAGDLLLLRLGRAAAAQLRGLGFDDRGREERQEEGEECGRHDGWCAVRLLWDGSEWMFGLQELMDGAARMRGLLGVEIEVGSR